MDWAQRGELLQIGFLLAQRAMPTLEVAIAAVAAAHSVTSASLWPSVEHRLAEAAKQYTAMQTNELRTLAKTRHIKYVQQCRRPQLLAALLLHQMPAQLQQGTREHEIEINMLIGYSRRVTHQTHTAQQ